MKPADLNNDGTIDESDASIFLMAFNKERALRKKIQEGSEITVAFCLRYIKNLTQKEAANIVHVDVRTWQYWENGKRTMSNTAVELFCIKNNLRFSDWIDGQIPKYKSLPPEQIQVGKLIKWPDGNIWALTSDDQRLFIHDIQNPLSLVTAQTQLYHGKYPAWLVPVSKDNW